MRDFRVKIQDGSSSSLIRRLHREQRNKGKLGGYS